MKNALLAFCFLLLSTNALSNENIFFVGSYTQKTSLQKDQLTHIIVVGTGNKEDSDQFFQSAILKAKIYQDRNHRSQSLIISNPDVINGSNIEVFRRFGLNIIATEKGRLNTASIIRLMRQFSQIASFDYLGHSSPWALNLSGGQNKFFVQEQRNLIASVRANFTKDAYANLNGCNTGFILAPLLSELWQIPVSGALTGSVFERLQHDNLWYKKIDRTDSERASFNRLTIDQDISCSKGGCWRMKPQRHTYSSYWGSFKSGLSFPKFFCRFQDTDNKCKKAIALSAITFPSSYNVKVDNIDSKTFKKIVSDILCSTNKNTHEYDRCIIGLKKYEQNEIESLNTITGNELICDFTKCDAKIHCQRTSNGQIAAGSCKLEAKTVQSPDTILKEYQAYLDGFKFISTN